MTDNITMPVFFVAHGSPMNALENNHFTADWDTLFKPCPTPTAIVVFSAHWHVPGTRILSVDNPKTIHDFGGFPPQLFQQTYPCPGAPTLAQQIIESLNAADIDAISDNNWGLDHGSWVVLNKLFPQANIPVLQVSLDNRIDDIHHHAHIADVLKPLRNEGVLFIGSGNIVHNIMKWMIARPSDSIEWASSFDQHIANAVKQRDMHTVARFNEHPFASDAVPTIEHFLPLAYALGLTDNNDKQTHSSFEFDDLGTACSRSIRFDAV
ncbi:4,5-DOPA dioxygenase extradiol [BD1-7 clade bacterium]|uniref:4,5-DOPA dioxygenase extradiol n=1 Tax=BD1-7 clade bacterium TaxID=2029982 RepID=A0A5S9QZF1_9GAMM|nr:4,5-DOPA dioxygenase extradiol [BD1-7 clade bacterium]